ncbi:GPW/gp25 family protein [Paracraurococcus lichenis]|uniref:GPW/gp25 family protein n=1 Tax=Paracraurococcus lichenis TaxID=3064888 RepID=A0ABT9EAA4_9PROT|nr:GPW/gp25 family protein [Paracraurococcus sp. LOR1-02]MDO9712898.1 GPW/gp25 family protein [Paracraurococcus sp. LOR1-02]
MSDRPDAGYRPFLGQGLRFPLEVVGGRLQTSRGERKIEEAIRLVLGTGPGERVMRPEFGCGAHDLVFSPNGRAAVTRIADRVRQALVRHEPRIDVLEVTAESPPERLNLLLVRIAWRVRANNAIGNMVYPFFVTEGT